MKNQAPLSFNMFRLPSLVAAALAMCTLLSLSLSAQESEKKAKAAEQDNPGTYLDKHLAIKEIPRLQELSLRDIQKIKTLLNNYGKQVAGSDKDFEAIKKTYKDAQVLWYKRLYLQSREKHLECRKLIFELYKKFSNMYDKQATQLLSDCSEGMANLEFAESSTPGKEIDYSYIIQQNSYKLQIAFQHSQQAARQQNRGNFSEAIHHFRMAKLFAIDVLKGLELDEAKRKELDKKYARDITDAKGFFVRAGK